MASNRKSLWQRLRRRRKPCLKNYRRARAELLEKRYLLAADLAGDEITAARPVEFETSNTLEFDAEIGDGDHGSADVDLYKLSLASGQSLEIDVDTSPSSQLSSYVKLFDSQGGLEGEADGYGGEALLTFTAGSSGDFFVGISARNNIGYDPQTAGSGSAGAIGDYEVKFTQGDPPASDSPGDDLTQAEPLSLTPQQPLTRNESIGNGHYPDSDVDLYEVNLLAGQSLEVDVATPTSALDSYIRLFDSLGEQEDDSASGYGGDTSLTFTPSSSGTFFIGITAGDNIAYDPQVAGSGNAPSGTGDYAATFTLGALPQDDTPGDRVSTAKLLSPTVTADADFTDSVGNGWHGTKDVDFYQLELTSGQEVTVDINTPGGSSLDSYLRLFDSSGSVLETGDNDSAASNPLDAVLTYSITADGTYYIGVSGTPNTAYDPLLPGSGPEGSTGDYTMVVSLTQNQPQYVVTTLTDVLVEGTTTDSLWSLREALDHHAQSNPEVPARLTFDAALFASPRRLELNGALGDLTVASNIEVVGPGVDLLTIDARQQSRIFDVGGFEVTISDMTLVNGVAVYRGSPYDNRGGAIFSAGQLTLTRLNIRGNVADWAGGGVHSLGDNADLVIHDSEISFNRAGAVFNPYAGTGYPAGHGGGVSVEQGNLLITNSRITSNQAGDRGGGVGAALGIWAIDAVTLINTTVANNSAFNWGGVGVALVAQSTIHQSVISDNQAFFVGGFGHWALTGGNLSISNSTIVGNSAVEDVGGVWAPSVPADINNSIIAGNLNWFLNSPLNAFATVSPTSDHNLIGQDNLTSMVFPVNNNTFLPSNYAGLQPVTANGHPALVPTPGSPAVNAGDPDFDPSTFDPPMDRDQLDRLRVRGGRIDIGATEFQAAALVNPVADFTVDAGSSITIPLFQSSPTQSDYVFVDADPSILTPNIQSTDESVVVVTVEEDATLGQVARISGVADQVGYADVTLQVIDAIGGPVETTFRVTVTEPNFPPVITVAPITIHEAGTVAIDADVQVTDANHSLSEITLAFRNVFGGQLIRANDLQPIDLNSFPAAELNDLRFVHDATATVPSLEVQATDLAGGMSSWVSIPFSLIGPNTPPELFVSDFSVLIGSAERILPGNLSAVDSHDGLQQLTYRILVPPTNGQLVGQANSQVLEAGDEFSVQDVADGFLHYVHDGLSDDPDAFSIEVVDSGGLASDPKPVNITITSDLLFEGTGVNELFEIYADRVDITPEGGATASFFYNVAIPNSLTLLAKAGDDEVIAREAVNFPILAYGEEGNDRLSGALGNDVLVGGTGDDTYLYSGDPIAAGGWGADRFVELPKEGEDTVDFAGVTTTAIRLDLSGDLDQTVIGHGDDNLLTVTGLSIAAIENVIGTPQNDLIAGNALPNTIEGRDGDDHLYGLAGNDAILGGPGDDYLAGGSGAADSLDGQGGLDNFEHLTATQAVTTGGDFSLTYDAGAVGGSYLSAPQSDVTPASSATWTFHGLPASNQIPYEVFVSWPDTWQGQRASDASFVVRATLNDGSTISLAPIQVDQHQPPKGEPLADTTWQSVGTIFDPTRPITEVTLELTNGGSSGTVLIDAVRLEVADRSSPPGGTIEGRVFQDRDGDGFRDLDLSAAKASDVAHFVFVLDASQHFQALRPTSDTPQGTALVQAKAIIRALQTWQASNKDAGDAYLSLIVHEANNSPTHLGEDGLTGNGTAAILDLGAAPGFQQVTIPHLGSFQSVYGSDLEAVLENRVSLTSVVPTSAEDLLERVDALFNMTADETWSHKASRHVFVMGGAFEEDPRGGETVDTVAVRNLATQIIAEHGAKFHGIDFNSASLDSSQQDDLLAINAMRLIDPQTRRLDGPETLAGLLESLGRDARAITTGAPITPDRFRVVSGPSGGRLLNVQATGGIEGAIEITGAEDVPFSLVASGLFAYQAIDDSLTNDSFVIVGRDADGNLSRPIVIDVVSPPLLGELTTVFDDVFSGDAFSSDLVYLEEFGRGALRESPAAETEVLLEDRLLFQDANRNGLQDGGEVFRYTNAQGQYTFDDLALLPAGVDVRAAVHGVGDPNDVERLTGWAAPVATVDVPTPVLPAADVGIAEEDAFNATISGYKYHDTNENGVRDSDRFEDNGAQDFLLIIDISFSTNSLFLNGAPVGDLNRDGIPNAIIDAQIQAATDFIDYVEFANQSRDENEKISVALLAFGAEAIPLRDQEPSFEDVYDSFSGLTVSTLDNSYRFAPFEYLQPGRADDTSRLTGSLEHIEKLRYSQLVAHTTEYDDYPHRQIPVTNQSRSSFAFGIGNATNYAAAMNGLANAVWWHGASGTYQYPPEQNQFPSYSSLEHSPSNVIFLSDGFPNMGESSPFGYHAFTHEVFVDEYAYLADVIRTSGTTISAYGLGGNVLQGPLDTIQGSPAEIIYNTDRLRNTIVGYTAEFFTEEGIAGWPIDVYRDEDLDGVFDPEEKLSPVASTVTEADGYYEISGLEPGAYFVRERQLSGFRQTGPHLDPSLLPFPLQRFAGDVAGKVQLRDQSVAGVTVIDHYIQIDEREHAPQVNFGNVIDTSFTAPNAAPEWTSTSPSSVGVGETYEYVMTATDEEGDALTFALGDVVWPDDYEPTPEHDVAFTYDSAQEQGRVSWNPDPVLAGRSVRFIERVFETGNPDKAAEPREVVIEVEGVNRPPVIWADPDAEFSIPGVIASPDNPDFDPDFLHLALAEGQRADEVVEFKTSDVELTAEIVFILDTSGSMGFGREWLPNVLSTLDESLLESGFSETKYGLVTLGVATARPLAQDGGLWGTVDELESFLRAPYGYNDHENGIEGLAVALQDYEFTRDEFTASQIILLTDDYNRGATPLTQEELRDTLLGSSSRLDDITFSLLGQVAFDGQVADPHQGFESLSGHWQVVNDQLTGRAGDDQSIVLSHYSLIATNNHSLTIESEIQLDEHAEHETFLAFNVTAPNDFYYVAARPSDDRWELGRVTPDVSQPSGFTRQWLGDWDGVTSPVAGNVHQVDIGVVPFDFQNAFNIEAADRREMVVGMTVNGTYGQFPLIDLTLAEDVHNIGIGSFGGEIRLNSISATDFVDPQAIAASLAGPRSLNLLLDRDFAIDSGHRSGEVVGVDSEGLTYMLGSDAGHQYGFDGGYRGDRNYHFAPRIMSDYGNLALDSGGTVWDYQRLRQDFSPMDFGDSELTLSEAFSLSFADAFQRIAISQVDPPDLAAESQSDLFVSASSRETNPFVYDLAFRGDGQGHVFDVQWIDTDEQGNDYVAATLPVFVTAAYQVDLFASDPDGGPLTFSLIQDGSEPWASWDADDRPRLIDSGHPERSNDRLVWNPPADAEGTYEFWATVKDSAGLAAATPLSWTVEVMAPADNQHLPVISDLRQTGGLKPLETPVPVERAIEISVIASDADDDTLRYALTDDTPDGMRINSSTGVITWVPSRHVADTTVDFTVSVSDGRMIKSRYLDDNDVGADETDELVASTTSQTFSLPVASRTFYNLSPYFDSDPSTDVTAGQSLVIELSAADQNGDALTYRLVSGPGGMTDPVGNTITWTPTAEQAGLFGRTHQVVVSVHDGNGGQSTQQFSVFVKPENRDPEIVFPDNTPIPDGYDLEIPFFIGDIDGDLLGPENVSLVEGPSWLRVEQDAADPIKWYLRGALADFPVGGLDDEAVTVEARDGKGGVAQNTGYLTVSADIAEIRPVLVPADGNDPRGVTPANEEYRTSLNVRAIVDRNATTQAFTEFRIADIVNQMQLDPISVSLGATLDFTNLVIGAPEPRADDANLANVLYSGIDVVWTPQEGQVGEHTIRVGVVDNQGLDRIYGFDVSVTPPVNTGEPPTLTSLIPSAAIEGQTWSFTVTAEDIDSDAAAVTWELLTHPTNPTPNVTSGVVGDVIEWSATSTDPDKHAFRLKLIDPEGNFNTYSFSIDVWAAGATDPPPPSTPTEQTPAQNAAPEFTTTFLPDFAVGRPVSLAIVADDPNGHTLQYQVTQSDVPGLPVGFDAPTFSGSGRLTWTPPQGSQGEYSLTIEAIDTLGARTSITYPVRITPNSRPSVLIPAVTPLFAGTPWSQDVFATDSDGDTLTVTINQEAFDAGMRVVRPGPSDASNHYRVVWDQPGPIGSRVPFSVSVSDGRSPARVFAQPQPLTVFDPGSSDSPINLSEPIDIAIGTTLNLQLLDQSVGGSDITWVRFTGDTTDPVPSDELPIGLTIGSDSVLRFTPQPPAPSPGSTQATEIAPVAHAIKLVAANDPSLRVNINFNVIPPSSSDIGDSFGLLNGTVYRTFAITDQAFQYTPTLLDPGDPYATGITWSADQSPDGTTFDPATGEIQWTAGQGNLGEEVAFKIRGVDAYGRIAQQELVVRVIADQSVPSLRTVFPSRWTFGRPLEVPLVLEDPNDDEVLVQVLNSSGAVFPGAVYNATTGVLTWTAPLPEVPMMLRLAKASAPEIYRDVTWQLDAVLPETTILAPFLANVPNPLLAADVPFTFPLESLNVSGIANPVYKLVKIDGLTPADYRAEHGLDASELSLSSSGMFSWTPGESEVGSHQLQVRVYDDGNPFLESYRSFGMQVTANLAPVVLSTGVLEPVVGTRLVHQILASDPEGGSLSYRFVDDAAASAQGFEIHPVDGTLQWDTPTDENTTISPIGIIVRDEHGAETTHSISIFVQPDTIPPSLQVYLKDGDGNIVKPSEELDATKWNEYVLWIEVDDNLGVPGVTWQLIAEDSAVGNNAGTTVVANTGEVNGAGSLWAVTFTGGLNQGLLKLALTYWDQAHSAVDDRLSQELIYYVNDPAVANVAKINSPIRGDLVDDRTDVYGVANLSGGIYDLKLTAVDDPNDFVYLVQNAPANLTGNNGPLASIDPTLIRSGLYRLYLEVNCGQGCIHAIDERLIEIRNDSGLGNLDLTFTDLSVDLGGIPVSLTRSYSSASLTDVGDASDLDDDFGPGWSLNLSEAGIQLSHPDRVTTRLGQALAEGTRVLVRSLDGSIDRFTFAPQAIGSDGLYQVWFRPDNDTYSTLTLAGQSEQTVLQRNAVRDDGTFVIAGGSQSYSADRLATAFLLTTAAGLKMHFDPLSGQLRRVEDQVAREVIIETAVDSAHPQWATEQSIRSRSGGVLSDQEVIIARNGDGRVLEILDPISAARYRSPEDDGDPQPVTYTYAEPDHTSNNTTLATITSRGLQTTTLGYGNSQYPFHLTTIADYADVTVLTADFYDSTDPGVEADQLGRLQSLIDASDQASSLGFTLDLGDGRMVTRVDDGNGIQVDQVVDNRGNLLRTVQLTDDAPLDADKQYRVTASIYNNRGLLTHQSAPYVVTGVANRYDETPEHDPLAAGYRRGDWASIITYDDRDRAITTSDALGNTTTFQYDDADRVTQTIDPNGIVTHNVFEPYTGNLLESYVTEGDSDHRFNHSRFGYNQSGLLTATYQVDGSTEQLISRTNYDPLTGRIAWTADASGNRQYFGYDLNGNQTHSWSNWTDGGSPATEHSLVSVTEYDPDGRTTATAQYELTANFDENDFETLKTALVAASPLSTSNTHYDDQGRVERSVDRYGAETRSVFDVRGNVVQSISQTKNENGDEGWLVSRTLYDDQGRVVFSADPYFSLGTSDPAPTSPPLDGIHTHYDELGRVTRSERHTGVTLTLVDDPASDLPANQTTTTSFDFTYNTPLSVSETAYDSFDRVLYTVHDLGVRTDYYYDATGRQIATLGPQVDVLDVTTGVLSPQRMLSISTFDAAGRLLQSAATIRLTDLSNPHPPLYDEATGQFDESLLDRASQQTTFYEYDAAGQQTAVITTQIEDPSNPTETTHLRSETVYDGFGRRTGAVTGLKQSNPLDAHTVDRAQERTTNYEFDVTGNLTAVILPAAEHPSDTIGLVRPRYEYAFDPYNNQRSIRDNVYQVGADRYYQHGGEANLVDADYDTRVTDFEFDHRGRQVSRTLPLGQIEQMVYDDTPVDPLAVNAATSVGNGQLRYMVDFEGRVTAYAYDNTASGGGRLIQKQSFPDLAAYADGAGTASETTFYRYDEFGRQTRVEIDRDASPTSIEHSTVNSYDDDGRLISVATNEATIHYEYSQRTGLRIRTYTTDPGGANVRTDVRNVYDTLGRLTHVIAVELADSDVNGTAIDWLDADGNSVSIDGDVTEYVYDAVGNLARVKLGNGLVTDHEYDPLNRLTRMVNYIDGNADGTFDRNANGDFDLASTNDTVRGSFEYDIDLFGKRTAATEILNTGADNTSAITSDIDWVYDGLGRLTQEDYDLDITLSNEPHDFIAQYTFDLVGNRLEKSVDLNRDAIVDELIAYEFDDNDRLLRERSDQDVSTNNGFDQTTFYEYGDGSNLSSGNPGSATTQTAKKTYNGDLTSPSGATISQTTFEYDLQGRMSVTRVDTDGEAGPNAEVVTTYEYDDSGVRIAKTVDGVTTRFVVDKNNLTGYEQVLEEGVDVDGDGQLDAAEIDKSYVIGHDVIAQAIADGAGAILQYLMMDGHGSTRTLLDDLADVITGGGANADQLFAYDAYGNLIGPSPQFVQATADAITTLLYSGEQTDASTGLQYLRARYYNSVSGRFNRLDSFLGSVSTPQTLHKYAYVHGDPIMGTDPSGEVRFEYDRQALRTGANIIGQIFKAALTYSVRLVRASGRGSSGLGIGRLFGVFTATGIVGGNAYVNTSRNSFRASATGTGGLEIGQKLRKVLRSAEAEWRRKSSGQKKRIMEFGAAYSLNGWDIWNLKYNQSMLANSSQAADVIPGTVTVDGNVYSSSEVNYVLWGYINELAIQEGIVGESDPELWIATYRSVTTPVFGLTGDKAHGTVSGRLAWSRAGADYARSGKLNAPTSFAFPLAKPQDRESTGNWSGFMGRDSLGRSHPNVLSF
ncbi:MAG: putative Ig domain-containing protein [Planctomycetota bacterium]